MSYLLKNPIPKLVKVLVCLVLVLQFSIPVYQTISLGSQHFGAAGGLLEMSFRSILILCVLAPLVGIVFVYQFTRNMHYVLQILIAPLFIVVCFFIFISDIYNSYYYLAKLIQIVFFYSVTTLIFFALHLNSQFSVGELKNSGWKLGTSDYRITPAQKKYISALSSLFILVSFDYWGVINNEIEKRKSQ